MIISASMFNYDNLRHTLQFIWRVSWMNHISTVKLKSYFEKIHLPIQRNINVGFTFSLHNIYDG